MEHRSHALLTELEIVVFFFLLASTVLIRLFTASREQSTKAALLADALSEAQSVADIVCHTDDPAATLTEMGFQAPTGANGNGSWILEGESRQTEVSLSEEQQPAGRMLRCTVQVLDLQGEELVSLPSARFRGVTP